MSQGEQAPHYHRKKEKALISSFVICVFPYMFQSKLVRPCTITEYDLGGEGDLFKAPEPIIEEVIMGLDPLSVAIGEDSILAQDPKVADIAALQNGPLLSEVFYECQKDLLEKAAVETSLSEASEIKIPPMKIDESQSTVNELPLDSPFQKSVSAGCLSSVEWIHGAALKPKFLEFSGLDLGAVYGMRRAFSEGDIKVEFTFLALHFRLSIFGDMFLPHAPQKEFR